jgi:hypothetical protein
MIYRSSLKWALTGFVLLGHSSLARNPSDNAQVKADLSKLKPSDRIPFSAEPLAVFRVANQIRYDADSIAVNVIGKSDGSTEMFVNEIKVADNPTKADFDRWSDWARKNVDANRLVESDGRGGVRLSNQRTMSGRILDLEAKVRTLEAGLDKCGCAAGAAPAAQQEGEHGSKR